MSYEGIAFKLLQYLGFSGFVPYKIILLSREWGTNYHDNNL